MLDENDISKLLRLKRYEQPPPGYFEDFLHDFHNRQRAELLRRPLWKIAAERVAAFFSEQTASSFAYAGATAAVLIVAGITSFNIVSSRNDQTTLVAQAAPVVDSQNFGLNSRVNLPDLKLTNQPINSVTASFRPRYIMDARPVSYEPASSF